MEDDLRSCLRSTFGNSKFCLAGREEDHIAACAGIELSQPQRDLLRASMSHLTLHNESRG
jgi:hypothetical protein